MHTKQQSGFTLVEIAVVVFLIGIMASVGLAALNAQMARASISTTQQKQAIIKDALISYLRTNLRLPCPAIDGTGGESRQAIVPPNCTATFGILPYTELGLTKSTALDGWENLFSYAVSPQWTAKLSTIAPANSSNWTNQANNAFNVGNTGTMTVNDRSLTSPYSTSTTTSTAVVFIVSHGKDGLGAFTTKATQNVLPSATNQTDQLANAPIKATWAVPAAFYQREYTDIDVPAFGAFDDVTFYLTANDFLSPLIKDGSLQSPQGAWTAQIAKINSVLIGYMFSNSSCMPPPDQSTFNSLLLTNGIPFIDPWGGILSYTPPAGFCRLIKDGTIKTINCSNNCAIPSECLVPTPTVPAFTVSTPTSAATIQPQLLTTIKAANANLLNACPAPLP